MSLRLDPITLQVIRNRLDMIVEEMQQTLLRVSHTSIVKNAQDATSAIFDVRGNTLAQASAVPAHLGMLIPAVKKVLEEYPPAKMEQDDIYLMNDPYDGGTHLPDITVVMPIFFEGVPVSLAATMVHHQDVGGSAPGSTPPNATELFAEGIVIPVMKLYAQGRLNEDLVKLLRRNVRVPNEFTGDLMAQVACCKTGGRRLSALFAEYGTTMVLRYYDELLDYAERLSRASIESIPDGDYRFYDYLDGNGVDPHAPLKIQVTMKVRGSELVADFEGTDPQAKGGLNSVPSSTGAAVYYTVRAICGPDVPNNAGAYRPIKLELPLGTIVNPHHPAACGARSVTVRRIAGAVQGAMAPAIPNRIPAACEGTTNMLYVGGIDPKSGRRFVTMIGVPTSGGSGARPDRDGLTVITHDTSNLARVPVEAFEQDYPFRLLECDTWTDSGGPGRWRGGLGFHAVVEVQRGECPLSIRRDRHDIAPWGLFGGKSAPRNRIVVHRADGRVEEMPSMIVIRLTAGDKIEFYTTGGGGHGDPLEREPWRVREDVLDWAVSREKAAEDYGVVLSDPDLEVDEAATKALRARRAAERGPITWVFDRGPDFTVSTGLPQYE